MKKATRITTEGGVRLKLHLERVLTTDTGADMLCELRKKYQIPKAGYKPPQKFFHVDNMNMPNRWLPKESLRKRAYLLDRLATDMAEVAHQLNIFLEYSIPSHFLDYVFYNAYGKTNEAVDEHLIHLDDSSMNLCYTSDMKAIHDSYLTTSPEEQKGQNENLSKFYKLFPVTLHISSDASIRAIRDYLQKNSSAIAVIQNKYKRSDSLLGKHRKRDPYKKQRDAFVWLYRSKPRQAFVNAFIKRFPGKDCPDIGAFNTIIAREKLRRTRKY